MAIIPKLHSLLSKSFRYEGVKKLKRKVRPLKHALVGRKGIYRAIELTLTLENARGKSVQTIFDIGAADGEYALTFLESFPKSTVWCFEPQSVSFELLERKLRFFDDRAKCFKTGFSDARGTAELNLDLEHPDGSSMLPPTSDARKRGKETVHISRIDDFVREHRVHHIEFLKIDVEGMEREVLVGGLDTIKHKVDNIFVEITLSRRGRYSPYYIEVLKLLNDAGFALLDISESENFFFSKLV